MNCSVALQLTVSFIAPLSYLTAAGGHDQHGLETMSTTPQSKAGSTLSIDSLDKAEKGEYDPTQGLAAPPPFVYARLSRPVPFDPISSPVSPVHEGLTPCTSVPELALPSPVKSPVARTELIKAEPIKKPAPPPKPKVSRWIAFELWFNVYKRFFVLVVSLNLVGIVLAALGRFTYAENHLGALVLGNLLCAILMRNELFVRFLYLLSIYGLRSVSLPPHTVYCC